MKKWLFLVILTAILLSACGTSPLGMDGTAAGTPTTSVTATFLPPTETPSPTATETPTVTPTPAYPPEGIGPSEFPTGVNPLTGLAAPNPALLERRPLAVKVSNLPRSWRPQWGLSLADIVYEYYTEQGATRMVGIFYGQDADIVGPIRSVRLFDGHLIRMYNAVLAFGSGDERVRARLFSTEYASLLVSEYPAQCPPMCRYEPNGINFLITNTAELSTYATKIGITNGRQDLTGMFFKLEPPSGGESAPRVVTRYSASIYNRWDYDAATGKYYRSSDTENDLDGSGEKYAALYDRLTNQPISADNVVVVYAPQEYYTVDPEIIDIIFTGPGQAFAFRDGQMYRVRWERPGTNGVPYLVYEDGTPFPFKPGNTWFEVMGVNSELKQESGGWRFIFHIP